MHISHPSKARNASNEQRSRADTQGAVPRSRTHRLFSHTVHTHLLEPSHLPSLLRAIRGALFPNNAPGVSTLVAPSSDDELRALRRRCASALLALVPRWLARLYLGGRGLALSSPRGGAATAAAPSAAQRQPPGAQTPAAAGTAGGGEADGETERVLAEIEEGIIDVFSDDYCNRHLLYGVLELVLVRLMPELADKGIAELWEERLS